LLWVKFVVFLVKVLYKQYSVCSSSKLKVDFLCRDEDLIQCLQNVINEAEINITKAAKVVVGMDTRYTCNAFKN